MSRHALTSALACLLLAFVGCGDEVGDSVSDGPASLAPAGVPIYVEAVLRPEGDQREEVETALSTLLGTDDPGAMLVAELDRNLADSGADLSWAADVEPWLGERAGLFIESFGDGQAQEQGALIVETTDSEAALATLEKGVASAGERTAERSYEGVDYLLETGPDPAAFGIVDEHLVAGSEDGLRSVVDTSEGDSLADADELGGDFDDLRSDSLVAFYAGLRRPRCRRRLVLNRVLGRGRRGLVQRRSSAARAAAG